MSRRSSPPRPIAEIPAGWTAHDGGDCPLPGEAMPAILFRSSSRFQANARRADSWGAMWRWGKRPASMDIVAWRLEDDETPGFVTIPRLDLGASC